MGVHVLAVYRPTPGQEQRLDDEMVDHVPALRRLGLATSTPSTVLRAPDGTVLEHFEWASRDAIATAHEHPEVLAMWERYEQCCSYGTLADLPNAATLLAEFEFIGSY